MKNKLTKLERNWILYDVANSAFTMMVSTIIPIYFKNLTASAGISASDSTAIWSYAASACTIIVVILGPLLSTVADHSKRKKALFSTFFLFGAAGCAALSLPLGWIAFLGLYVLTRVGYVCGNLFYDSMLTDVTDDDRMDTVSSYGYAWGYIGSCVPFIACLLLILTAGSTGIGTARATKIAFFIIAGWWVLMTIPLLKSYRQRYAAGENRKIHLSDPFVQLGVTLKEILKDKKVLFFLLAYFCYIDGVHTIIDMATVYGKDVGIGDTHLLLALLLTQIVAFPCVILFNRWSKKYSVTKIITLCIVGYFLIALFALQLDKAWEFWFLAVCVALFQGSIQALSRSYYARLIPKEKSSEYFGFFDIFGKGAAFFGTFLIGLSNQFAGNSKPGIALLAMLFIVGYLLFKHADKQPAKEY